MAKYDDILTNYIKPTGRWQWQTYLLFMSASTPFALIYFHMFTGLRPHHFCRPAGYGVVNEWTKIEWMNLTAPPKIPQNPKSQRFESCRAYVLPKSVNLSGSFEEARAEMDIVLSSGNVSTEECSHGWLYFPDSVAYSHTTVETFDLVCQRSGLTLASSTAFLLGFIAGALSFGEIGDRYGRRKTGILALIMGILSSIFTASSPVFPMYVIGRFLTGMFVQGHVVVMYTLVMEISGPAARDIFSVLLSFIISVIFLFFYTLFAYLIPSWRWLYIILSSPMLLVVLYFPFMPESPRWLLGQGRKSEALQVINKAIQINNPSSTMTLGLDDLLDDQEMKLNPILLDEEEEKKSENEAKTEDEPDSSPPALPTILDLVRGSGMRRITLLMMMLWFYQAFSYYGASFYSVKMPGVDPYLSVSAPSLVKMVALGLQIILARRLKRRLNMLGLQLTGSIFLIIVAVLFLLPESPARDVSAVVFMSLLLGFVVAGFCLCYVYSSEVFPTELRSRGIGICSTIGRVGAALAPLVVDLDRVFGIRSLPMAVCGIVGLISAFAGWFLPETKNRPLMEKASEVEERLKKKRRSDVAETKSQEA